MHTALPNITNTIINGDCLHILPQLQAESVDFILTDPPYLVNYKDRTGRSIKNDNNDAWLKPAFAEMYCVFAHHSFCISFYGWSHADHFIAAFRSTDFRIVGHLVFPKRYTSTTRHLRYQYECAYVLVKGYPKVPEYPIGEMPSTSCRAATSYTRPRNLYLRFCHVVETFSKSGGLVLVPFAGSGSTLHAARSLGHPYLSIGLDASYHAAIELRKLTGERLATIS